MTAIDPTARVRARVSVLRRGRNLSPFDVVAGVVCIAIAALVVYPLGSTLVKTFFPDGHPDATPIRNALELNGLGAVFRDTAVVVGLSVAISMVVSVVLAWLNERTNARMGAAGSAVPMLPLVIPALAGTVGWVSLASPVSGVLNVYLRDLLGAVGINMDEGPLNLYSYYGVIFLYMLYLVPFGYVVLSNALRNLDPSLEEASRVAGAGVARTFFSVTLPAIRPAIFGALTMQLIIGMAMFSVPIVVGLPSGLELISVRIFRMLTASYPAQTSEAVVLALVLLVIILGVTLAQRQVMKNQRYGIIGGRSSRSSVVDLGRAKWPARLFVVGYMACTSVLPIVGLVLLSIQPYWAGKPRPETFTLDNYREVFALDLLRDSLLNSIVFGIQGGVILMLVATIVSLYTARMGGTGARLMDAIVRLPATLPHLIIAVAFIAAFAGSTLR